jgi:sterol desaturase/sphingolipid hydroxylase (fatty acid hydroxylase superfamily)
VTTAIRFHPAEIALSMVFKIGLVYVLGPAAWTVVFFEILLNASAMFNHANIALPQWLDRMVRSILVTPDMHRIHHSVHRHEHDTNFGFALSWWDRLFGTYTQSPQDGHKAMKIGLHWQDLRPTSLLWSLAMPFFRK